MATDFETVFSTLTAKANQYHGKTLTEEATKHFLILPFISALGYDVFDIAEVMPEYTADLGTKQKEKIDYAILRNGEPIILIECKPVSSQLSVKNEAQLLRYYHTSNARFAILTNGIHYKFFTDSEKSNIMDTTPFFELNLNNPDKASIDILEKFQKTNFDTDELLNRAKHQKHITLAKNIISAELSSPSDELIHLIASKMYPQTRFTEKFRKELTPIIISTFSSVINSKIMSALDTTLETVANNEESNLKTIQPHEIVTTQDEYEVFYAIRAICLPLVSPERIVMRDAKSYCAVLFDDNNRKPVARLYFNNPNKMMIGFFSGKEEEKLIISSVQEIYNYKDILLGTVQKYLKHK